MKQKAIVAIGSIAVLVTIVSSNVYLFSKALQPKTIFFATDSLFSDYSTAIFTDYATKKATLAQSATILYNKLHEEIPVLKQVSINYNGSQQAHAYFKALTPQAVIKIDNHNYILTENNSVFNALYYNPAVTQKFPSLQATSQLLQEKNDSAALQQFLQKVPQWVFDSYTVYWQNQTEIFLQHAEYKNFYILTKYDTIYSPKLITSLESIKKIVEEKNKKTDWKADIRFNDQIVLSPYKKGGV